MCRSYVVGKLEAGLVMIYFCVILLYEGRHNKITGTNFASPKKQISYMESHSICNRVKSNYLPEKPYLRQLPCTISPLENSLKQRGPLLLSGVMNGSVDWASLLLTWSLEDKSSQNVFPRLLTYVSINIDQNGHIDAKIKNILGWPPLFYSIK